MRGMSVYCRVAPMATSCGRFTTSAKSCSGADSQRLIVFCRRIEMLMRPTSQVLIIIGDSRP